VNNVKMDLGMIGWGGMYLMVKLTIGNSVRLL
jgi:hypothetical protein